MGWEARAEAAAGAGGLGGRVQAPPPARRLPRLTSGVAAAGRGLARGVATAVAARGVAMKGRRARGCNGGGRTGSCVTPAPRVFFCVFFHSLQ